MQPLNFEETQQQHGVKFSPIGRSPLTEMPAWLRRSIGKASEISTVQQIIKQRQIHTIVRKDAAPTEANAMPKARRHFC